VRAKHLQSGASPSCGCISRERRKQSALSHHAEYPIWAQAKQRCFNPRGKAWPDYGGRGITMCEEWRKSFFTFYKDMGPRPSPKHSVERIDNDGNYEPNNCRWATQKEQCNNTRVNLVFEFYGETRTVSEWATHLGVPLKRLRWRLQHGWPITDAIKPPFTGPRQHCSPR